MTILFFAILIGLYSYLIFFLGIFGFLYKNVIVYSSIVFWFFGLIYLFKNKKVKLDIKKLKLSNTSKFLIFLIGLQACVNFVGVLGPEISFDALWYHLTLPKLYLENHLIFHIPGGLLYYSDMPKLTEMLYVSALSVSNETLAKFIHFSFGLLTLLAIYKIARKSFSQETSILACIVFYSSLVVGWESISAYTDLTAAFFTTVAVLGFINWIEKRNTKNLVMCAILIGFAITSKVVLINLLFILTLLILFIIASKKIMFNKIIKSSAILWILSIVIPLPWFIFSYINTGNPFYPLFDLRFNFPFNHDILTGIKLLLISSDPINPIYVISIPIIIVLYKKYNIRLKVLSVFTLLAIVFWLTTTQIGGTRFLLAYLPVFSVLSVSIIHFKPDSILQRYMIFLIISIALLSVSYRGIANTKFIPYIFGNESKKEFLTNNLNFSFGDFYDTDDYFKNNIKSSDKILLYGFHNLYYVNFPFIDSSWVKKGDRFNYIATQNLSLPTRFADWTEVYYNKTTKVKLYTMKGKMWAY